MTRLTAEVAAYLATLPAWLFPPDDAPAEAHAAASEGRRIFTRLEPRLFALVYLRHHLTGDETGGLVSFSEAQLEWYDHMQQWVRPITKPKAWRRGYVAPRASAKSTTWYLIAPLWAAAHGHAHFIAAFSDSAGQAEQHLATLKHELETNTLLRKDYPELCRPATRARGQLVSDNRAMMQQGNGFVFAARGVDSSNLGLKVGERRPDLMIFDDIEPDASNYSAALVEKRLATVQNALLPLNDWARVVLVGTVTMPGSLIHQLVQTVTTSLPPAPWVTDEAFTCHYYPALVESDDGELRSLWPEKWPLPYLLGMRHTRSFALNMQNKPLAIDGVYWQPDDIRRGDAPLLSRSVLSIDPAVTTKKTSDYTGLAVLSHDKPSGQVWVRWAKHVKLGGAALRAKVASVLEDHPDVRVLLVETNQGGDLAADLFAGLGVKVVTVHQQVKKEERAGWLLNGYQRGKVKHAVELPDLEDELLAFPTGLHDDLVDAVGSGYTWLTGAGREQRQAGRPGVRQQTYVA